jgi:hypothetical protein
MMKNDLSNLELDEVSLVGKAANGKKFLIYKSMQKSKGSNVMMKTRPSGAKTGAPVTKADIEAMVSEGIKKAVAPLVETVKKQSTKIRKTELEGIAKAHLGELGNPGETATILKSLEDSDMPAEAKENVLKALKQANAIKKEAMGVMGGSMGHNRPVPGSATAQFETLVEKHLKEIRKSDTGNKNAKVLRARAVTKASEENPELAKAVMLEHRQNVHAAYIGGRQ